MTILVTGGHGQLGGQLGTHAGIVALGREDLDICDPASIQRALDIHRPRYVIHCAAFTNVDGCTRDPVRAHRVNAGGTEAVAAACAEHGIPLLHISTDYVVGGPDTPGHRLSVDAPVQALSIYARSKWAAEEAVRAHGGTIVRVQWVYSVHGAGFINRAIEKMRSGVSVPLVTDQVGCPTPARLLATWLLELTEMSDLPPIVHLATTGAATPADWVCAFARALGVDPIWHPVSRAILTGAPRPARSCLDVSGTEALFDRSLPDWADALGALVAGPASRSQV
jgi:dTDP-4-dehydrorhamnose reductase